MSLSKKRFDFNALNRRSFLAGAAGLAGAAAFGLSAFAQDENAIAKTGVDPTKWNTETINALAGTITVDTAAELHALVPPDTASGDLSFWNAGPVESTPQIAKDFYQQFQDSFKTWYPNINLDNQNVDYNDLLDKLRTAAAGGAAPARNDRRFNALKSYHLFDISVLLPFRVLLRRNQDTMRQCNRLLLTGKA